MVCCIGLTLTYQCTIYVRAQSILTENLSRIVLHTDTSILVQVHLSGRKKPSSATTTLALGDTPISRLSPHRMEVIAGDLSLLGMPFLLSKAADAASDFDARECPKTAEGFVRACLDVKALFEHPELAGLGDVMAQLHSPTLVPLPSPCPLPAEDAEGDRPSREALASPVPGTMQGLANRDITVSH
jgi:hypothetical protein